MKSETRLTSGDAELIATWSIHHGTTRRGDTHQPVSRAALWGRGLIAGLWGRGLIGPMHVTYIHVCSTSGESRT